MNTRIIREMSECLPIKLKPVVDLYVQASGGEGVRAVVVGEHPLQPIFTEAFPMLAGRGQSVAVVGGASGSVVTGFGGEVHYYRVGQSMTGCGHNLLIVDSLTHALHHPDQYVYDWFTGVALTRIVPFGSVIVHGGGRLATRLISGWARVVV